MNQDRDLFYNLKGINTVSALWRSQSKYPKPKILTEIHNIMDV